MKKQMGVSLSGLIMVIFGLIVAALIGFKVFPPYSEYMTIKKAFKQMAANPAVKAGEKSAAMAVWFPIAQVSNIKSITGDDIEITQDGNDVVVSANYTTIVPLFKNVSIMFVFAPSSADK